MNLKRLYGLKDPFNHSHMHHHTGVSRRHFLKAGLGVATASLLAPSIGWTTRSKAFARQSVGMPNPIPHIIDMGELGTIHFYLPTPTLAPPGDPTIDTGGGDPSTITDFTGSVGVFEPFGGTGLATNPDGSTEELFWAADVRFMDGQYVDVDGNEQEAAFAFI
jgi:hypothetical protein